MSFESIVQNIPEYDHFLTVDELDAALLELGREYPEKVEVFEAGKSRKGHSILCAKIGSGSRNALMFGCPHPNEPIGAMMAHYFSRAIAEDDALREKLDFTWYIMPVSDVDGTKLNEGWFKGPFTLYNYARDFFRPAGYEQVEWTFPMAYKNYSFDKPIPETQALMKIIDEKKPVFMFSLHNSGFGGAYWYVSKPQPNEVYTAFHAAAKSQNIPIDLGEPEVPFATVYAPAVFKLITTIDSYDYYESTGEDPVKLMQSGGSSSEYAGDGCTTLVAEVPYFFEPRVDSHKLLDFTRREAVMKKLDENEKMYKELGGYFSAIESDISEDNPFAKMVKLMVQNGSSYVRSERAFAQKNPEYDMLCKESEALSNLDVPKFYGLLNWGLLVRSMEHELQKKPAPDVAQRLAKLVDECEGILKERAKIAEKALNYRVIPIKSLLSIQLQSGLAVAGAL